MFTNIFSQFTNCLEVMVTKVADSNKNKLKKKSKYVKKNVKK